MKFQSYDLGMLKRGAVVVVQLSGNAANVQLMDSTNFSNYKRGTRYRYTGGLAKRSPVRLTVPSEGHWYVAIDLGGLRGTVRSSVAVERGALPVMAPSRMTASLNEIRHEAPPDRDHVEGSQVWDVFISHASEDKAAVVKPLAERLRELGVTVWYDGFELRIGDSLSRRIDAGLAGSRFGIVVLSHDFFRKGWPQYELDGLVTLQVSGKQSLLPIWHEISKDEVVAQSPSLADKIARSTAQFTIEEIANEIASVVRPDLVLATTPE